MGYKFNPLPRELDYFKSSQQSSPLGFWLSSLSAYDKVLEITYLDQGLRTQRIDSMTLTSADVANANVTASVSWLDVGTMNQRIDSITFSGAVFSSQDLVKTFVYSASGFKYIKTGYAYDLI